MKFENKKTFLCFCGIMLVLLHLLVKNTAFIWKIILQSYYEFNMQTGHIAGKQIFTNYEDLTSGALYLIFYNLTLLCTTLIFLHFMKKIGDKNKKSADL